MCVPNASCFHLKASRPRCHCVGGLEARRIERPVVKQTAQGTLAQKASGASLPGLGKPNLLVGYS